MNPAGPAAGSCRVLRGGGGSDGAAYCRSAFRDIGAPCSRYGGWNDVGSGCPSVGRYVNLRGFRLARDL